MADITKCSNKLCTLKERCYRFTSAPNEYRQAYAEFSQDDEGDCDYFLSNKVKAE